MSFDAERRRPPLVAPSAAAWRAQRDEADAERDRAVESIRNALLAVLEVRRLAVADDEHAAIAACRDPERLAWWLARAALVPAVAELFETA